jgi:hypothetical protein
MDLCNSLYWTTSFAQMWRVCGILMSRAWAVLGRGPLPGLLAR